MTDFNKLANEARTDFERQRIAEEAEMASRARDLDSRRARQKGRQSGAISDDFQKAMKEAADAAKNFFQQSESIRGKEQVDHSGQELPLADREGNFKRDTKAARRGTMSDTGDTVEGDKVERKAPVQNK